MAAVFGDDADRDRFAYTVVAGDAALHDCWWVESYTPAGLELLRCLRRLFRESGSLTAEFSDGQIADGLSHIACWSVCSDVLLMRTAPWSEVEPALLSLFYLYRDVIAVRCGSAEPDSPVSPGTGEPSSGAEQPKHLSLRREARDFWSGLLRYEASANCGGGDMAPAIGRLLLGILGRIAGLPSETCRASADCGLLNEEWLAQSEAAALAARLLRRCPRMSGPRRALYESMAREPQRPAVAAANNRHGRAVGAAELDQLRRCLLVADPVPPLASLVADPAEIELAWDFGWRKLFASILQDRTALSRMANTPALLNRLLWWFGPALGNAPDVPWPVRERCWRALPEFSSKLFGPVCGDVLPWETGAGRLHNLCVWFWWLVPCPALVVDQALACRLDALQLELIRETLAMPWESCQAAGLKALLLRALHDQPGVGDALDWYLTRGPSARMQQLAADVREYAEAFGAT